MDDAKRPVKGNLKKQAVPPEVTPGNEGAKRPALGSASPPKAPTAKLEKNSGEVPKPTQKTVAPTPKSSSQPQQSKATVGSTVPVKPQAAATLPSPPPTTGNVPAKPGTVPAKPEPKSQAAAEATQATPKEHKAPARISKLPKKKDAGADAEGQDHSRAHARAAKAKSEAAAKAMAEKLQEPKPKPKTERLPKPHKNLSPDEASAEKKARGRIARSLRERSWLSLIIFVSGIALVVGVLFWYNSGEANRVAEDLKKFDIPTEADVENFRPKTSSSIILALDAGPTIIPILVQRYPKMTLREKVATVIILGEFRDTQGIETLVDAACSDQKILAAFGSRSLGRLGEAVVKPVMAKFETANDVQRNTLLEGMARTNSPAAYAELVKLARGLDEKVSPLAVSKLAYYGQDRKTIETLLDVITLDKSNTSSVQADEVFYKIYKDGKLAKYNDELIPQIKKRFGQTQEPVVRAHFLKLMGMAIAMQSTKSGEHLSTLQSFKEQLRKSLASPAPEEVAAGAYGLGLCEDSDSQDRLLGLLDHDNVLITENIASALNNLNDAEVAQKILATSLAQSQRPHVRAALAKIFGYYHLHMVKLGLQEKVMQLLTAAQKDAPKEVADKLAETITIYQKTQK